MLINAQGNPIFSHSPSGLQCAISPIRAMDTEHRWIHPAQHEVPHAPHGHPSSAERMPQTIQSCAAAGQMNMVEPNQLLPPDEVDVFFHHLDGSGNAANWSYSPSARAYRPSVCHGPTAFQDPQNQNGPQGSCSRVFLPTARVSSGQVCRPHFHTPIQWIESKPHGCPTANPASVWCPTFQPTHRSNPMPVPGSIPPSSSSGSHSSQHLFSFPPTPPKESTPEMGANNSDIFSYGDDKTRMRPGMPFGTPRPDVAAFAGYPSQVLPHYVGSELNMSSFGPLPGLPGIMANRNFHARTRTKSRSNSG